MYDKQKTKDVQQQDKANIASKSRSCLRRSGAFQTRACPCLPLMSKLPLKVALGFHLQNVTKFCKTLHLPQPTQSPAMMAHPLPRLLSGRLWQSSPVPKASRPILRGFRAPHNSPARRTYATGESGPNPKPGQSPFKVWPFIAITLAGSGAYILMVKTRSGAP
jgi:hypothetical protein